MPHHLDGSVSKFGDHVVAQWFDDGHDHGCLSKAELEFQHQLGTWANANCSLLNVLFYVTCATQVRTVTVSDHGNGDVQQYQGSR